MIKVENQWGHLTYTVDGKKIDIEDVEIVVLEKNGRKETFKTTVLKGIETVHDMGKQYQVSQKQLAIKHDMLGTVRLSRDAMKRIVEITYKD